MKTTTPRTPQTALIMMPTPMGANDIPSARALARHAGWTAHIIEQAGANRLIRPDAIYTGPTERDLPA